MDRDELDVDVAVQKETDYYDNTEILYADLQWDNANNNSWSSSNRNEDMYISMEDLDSEKMDGLKRTIEERDREMNASQ